MYSKEAAKQLKESFWTALGRYMSLHLNHEGREINWINYKTGIKGLTFRKDADQHQAFIAIEVADTSTPDGATIFERLGEYRSILHGMTGEEWHWDETPRYDINKVVGRISATMEGVNIYNRNDWPAIFTFLKDRMIHLDAFWCVYHEAFDEFKSPF